MSVNNSDAAKMSDDTQERVISHRGSELGAEAVTLTQNQVSPQLETPVASFECPSKYERLHYVGRRHPTKFIPRSMETISGDGAETDFALTADLAPIAGETDIEDQPYPTVRAVNTGTGNELTIESVDYATNTVTFAAAPANGSDNIKLYPVIVEGDIGYFGVNQFGQVQGSLYEWKTGIYRFADFPMDKRGTEVRLHGQAVWSEFEKLKLYMDSPRQIVWTDDDYPDAYVSTLEQRVDITL